VNCIVIAIRAAIFLILSALAFKQGSLITYVSFSPSDVHV
jgi:hypothetical protein